HRVYAVAACGKQVFEGPESAPSGAGGRLLPLFHNISFCESAALALRPPGPLSLVVCRSSSRCLFGKHRCYIHFNCHIGPRQLTHHEERRCRDRSAAESLGTAFQCVLKKANVRSIGHYSYDIVHRRALHIEQFFDFHVSVPALLHEIALVNDFAITLAFRANSSKKDELSWICNSHDFRELALCPFVVIEILFLKVRRALSNGKRV